MICGGTLIYVWVDWLIQYYFVVGYSDNFVLHLLGKKKCLVLSLIWFYILDDFILYSIGMFCLFLEMVLLFERPTQTSHSRDFNSLAVLTCLVSHNFCTAQDLKRLVPDIA